MRVVLDWKMAVLSFLTGCVLGVVFVVLRLPVPAPGVFEGALGVVGATVGGIWVGPWIVEVVSKWFKGI